ncbi:heterokaryon incompatibility protein [Colletotrichum kahawae]|uniref:Heterokaryon incompatibility protein n=1 Tax=Colletotrichum kahawae TaxID=34407 RepID=A0AAD9YSY2_COLKA|nr:heterokaryon incompatibility protein [Colletotrichum kahawae]
MHALSYVWGDPTPTATIKVDGQYLPIGSNLQASLLRLREDEAMSWFWVDAICINQENQDERNQQTAQMRDIFAQAASVHIWLGPASDNSHLAMDMAKRIGADALEAGVLDLWNDWMSKNSRVDRAPEDAQDDEALQLLADLLNDTSFHAPPLLKAVSALLSRPNWFRSWIIQEIALPPSGLILCGDQQVPLDAFDAAITAVYFCKVGRFPKKMPQWQDFGAGLDNNAFHLRGLIARRQRRRGQDLNLAEFLLSELRSAPDRPFYAATDPRDIIFGVLGIAADTVPLHLRPDYSKTTPQVYAEATRAMIEQGTHYRLEYCTFPKDTPDLPSWVPDWRRVGLKGVEINPMSYRDLFRSSGDRFQPKPRDLCESNHRVLRRRGCLVDTVSSVFQIGLFEGRKQTLSDALISERSRSWALRSIMDFSMPFLKSPAAEIRLWRTMVSDWMGISRCSSEFDVLSVRAFRQDAVPAGSLTSKQMEYILRNTYPYPLRPGPDSNVEKQALVYSFCDRVIRQAASQSRKRTLFVTDGGRFGLGPETMQRDDEVTIIFGTQVPIVLRPCEQQFRFLGDAYVDEIMDGEAIKVSFEEIEFEII